MFARTTALERTKIFGNQTAAHDLRYVNRLPACRMQSDRSDEIVGEANTMTAD